MIGCKAMTNSRKPVRSCGSSARREFSGDCKVASATGLTAMSKLGPARSSRHNTSRTRQFRRLLLGVNRKSTGFRWMNGLVVEIKLSKRKAEQGVEKSCQAKRRSSRGQRKGKPRGETARKLRRACLQTSKPTENREKVNLARSLGFSAPKSKTLGSRKANHSGRKFIWALIAGNRLAEHKSTHRLQAQLRVIREGGPRSIGVDNQSRKVNAKTWQRFYRMWYGIKYRARHIGIPDAAAVGPTAWSFLAEWDPALSGKEELMEMIEHLPRRRVTTPKGAVVPASVSNASFGPPKSLRKGVRQVNSR